MKHLLAGLLLLLLTAPTWAAKPAARPAAVSVTQVRVLVALGPSTYFFSGGRPHGVEYAWLLEFEKYINHGKDKAHQIKLQFIPVEPGELIPALIEGRGDIAAGLIPASEGVKHLVAVSEPYLVDSWCVAGRKGESLPKSLDELAAEGVTQPTSSYARRLLLDVNETRRVEGLPEVVAKDAGAGVTAEMLLAEMQKGGKRLALTSRFVTGLWRKIFTKVEQSVCLEMPVPLVWAVQKEHHSLLLDLNHFIAARKNSFIQYGIDLTQRYLHPNGVGSSSRMIDPLDKLAFFAPIFQFAASANNLDWLLLAAIGQRETGLSAVKRERGPTGVMQVNPSTARMMGIKNPHDTGQNVTAAARYLSYLRDMFTSPDITPEDQLYFMLAAYNAGEGRLQGLRNKAAAQGLNPNRWLGNVETVAQRSVGQPIVNYVTAVSRYYLAYQSAEKKRLLEQSRVASAPVPAVP